MYIDTAEVYFIQKFEFHSFLTKARAQKLHKQIPGI